MGPGKLANKNTTTTGGGPFRTPFEPVAHSRCRMDDFEDDAVSLRSIDLFVPTKLDTVVEEDEPVDAESVYSFSEDEKGDYHAWLRLTVVQQGKTLSSRPKWKEKWCRLTDGQLHFQISPNPKVDEKESKMIEMASIQLIVQDETGEHPDRFAMVSGRQTYYCLTRDEQATLVWVKHLLQAKQTSAHRLGIRQRTSP